MFESKFMDFFYNFFVWALSHIDIVFGFVFLMILWLWIFVYFLPYIRRR